MPGGPDHMRPIDELTTRLCFVNFDGSLSLSESRQRGLTCKLDVNFVKEFCAPVYGGVMVRLSWSSFSLLITKKNNKKFLKYLGSAHIDLDINLY